MTVFDGRAAAVSAFGEITITSGDIDRGGLTDRAMRRVRGACYGIDPGSRLIVRLGPMTVLDEELARFLSTLPCSIEFGGAWKAGGGGSAETHPAEGSALRRALRAGPAGDPASNGATSRAAKAG